MKVFIEGSSSSLSYKNMFLDNGWEVVTLLVEADLVCFTGGEDVSPLLYQEKLHPSTSANIDRDTKCVELFYRCLENNIPMVGICRGAQFLNVMCGGTLYQHVVGHATGKSHFAVDIVTSESLIVSSTHHQMMIPGDDAEVILIAECSTRREYNCTSSVKHHEELPDIEALWYEPENALCFQPHPEYFDKDNECQKFFFNSLQEYLYD